MNMTTLRNFFIATLLLCVLSACSTSPKPRLYVIEPMATSVSDGARANEGLSITVGPVTLPEHLSRKGIVTHDQRYRVISAEFDRWAEPLDENIARVLSENLFGLIPGVQVVANSRGVPQRVDYTVPVRITNFGSNPDGQVVLDATWAINDAAGAPVQRMRTMYSSPRRGDDVVSLVAAMSEAVEQLSRDIANAIAAVAEASAK